MPRKFTYPDAGKTLVLTPAERFALLQALGARRSYLETAPALGLTASGRDQLACIKELISRLGYTQPELDGQVQLDLEL
jgi:hypothetical protein